MWRGRRVGDWEGQGIPQVQTGEVCDPFPDTAGSDTLDGSQIRAHEGCKPGVYLIQGPPGTSLQEEMVVSDQTIQ